MNLKERLNKLPADKILHLKAGALFAAGAVAVLLIASAVGHGVAVAAASVVMGWGVERYQAIRHEGEASKTDWLASSAPGVVLGATIEAALRFGWWGTF